MPRKTKQNEITSPELFKSGQLGKHPAKTGFYCLSAVCAAQSEDDCGLCK